MQLGIEPLTKLEKEAQQEAGTEGATLGPL